MVPKMVLDTNVLIAAIRSRRGASFRLLSLIDSGVFQPCVSVPLVLEYESVAKRHASLVGLTKADVDVVVDYLCRVATHHTIYYLWRPILKDPKDDMVLEVAVSARADAIVTFNQIDFTEAETFGISVRTLREFLTDLGELP